VSAIKRRERIHRLVDQLPEAELHAAERFLEFLATAENPVLRALWSAPEEEEPLTPEEAAALEEAYADLNSGQPIPDAELWRRLGHDPEP